MPTNSEITKEIAEKNKKSCEEFEKLVKNEIDKTQADKQTKQFIAQVNKESEAFNKACKNGFFDSINKKSAKDQTENSSSLKP